MLTARRGGNPLHHWYPDGWVRAVLRFSDDYLESQLFNLLPQLARLVHHDPLLEVAVVVIQGKRVPAT
jgi:hypothetical protein